MSNIVDYLDRYAVGGLLTTLKKLDVVEYHELIHYMTGDVEVTFTSEDKDV